MINIDVDNIDWLEEKIAVSDSYVTRKSLLEQLFRSYLKENKKKEFDFVPRNIDNREKKEENFIYNYFGQGTIQLLEKNNIEINKINKVFESIDQAIESIEDEDFQEELMNFEGFYVKETPQECLDYLYAYIKKYKHLIPQNSKDVNEILVFLKPLVKIYESRMKTQNKKELKEKTVIPTAEVSDEQRSELLRQVISIQTASLKLFEFVEGNIRDKSLSKKVSKIVSYMEEFRNFISEKGNDEVDTKVPLDHGENGEQKVIESIQLKENKEKNNNCVKKEAISRLSQFFRVSPGDLEKFKFDGTDDISELTKVLNSTSEEGTKLYYDVAIKLSKEDCQEELDESKAIKVSSEFKKLNEGISKTGNIDFKLLKNLAISIGKQKPKLKLEESKKFRFHIENLVESKNINEFNLNLEELYDWADGNEINIVTE